MLVQAFMVLSRSSPKSCPFLCYMRPRLSARLVLGAGVLWLQESRWLFCWLGPGLPHGRAFPGPVLPWSSSKLRIEVGRSRALLTGKNPPCISPPGLSARDLQFCDAIWCACKVHCHQTRDPLCHDDNGLWSLAWTTPQALWAVSGQLGQVHPWAHLSKSQCLAAVSPSQCEFWAGKCVKVVGVRAGFIPLIASKPAHVHFSWAESRLHQPLHLSQLTS